MQRRRPLPLDPWQHVPSSTRPLRARARRMPHDSELQPHEHDWGQLVFSLEGAVRVLAEPDGQAQTFVVPPTRAVWVPPRVRHAVMALSDAELRTLYVHAEATAELARDAPEAWSRCRALEVSPLARELVRELALDRPEREAVLNPLLLDELRRAAPLALGLALPQDKRLRKLCEALLADPLQHASLLDAAREVGASERHLHRLFRAELGCSWRQWREQALLAQALHLAANGHRMSAVAEQLGYGSASAFGAMVKRAVGVSARRFFAAR